MMELGLMYGVSEYYLNTMKKTEAKPQKSTNVSFYDLMSIKPAEKAEEKKQEIHKRMNENTVPEQTQQNETESDVVVKPDGSRVLVVTMNIRGVASTMSMKLSDPTIMPNDIARHTEKYEETIDNESRSFQNCVDYYG